MALMFIEEGDRSFRSGMPDEEIRPGHLVSKQGDKLVNATASTGVDGIVERPNGAWWGAEHPYDYRPRLKDFTYAPDDLQRTPMYPLGKEGAVYFRAYTPEDPGDGTVAPTYEPDMVLGVIDEYPGCLVPEGYEADFTDDSTDNPTTFNRENGNFVAVGETRNNAPEFSGSDGSFQEYDELVHVDTLG